MPFNSVKELVAYAKANPGKLMNASSSNGSPGHVGGELFKYMTGTDILHIPYKGGAQAINDLIAGHVHLMFESLNSISSTAKGGKVRALGVSGPRRSPAFPELPTIAEAGVPGYDAGTWSGVIAPAGVPRPIVDKLNAAINRAIATPAFKERFGKIGDEPAGGSPEEFAATIAKDSAKWADVVKRSGAKFD
jgi:tripartite-type tricarboxylate transporter receptor subunit TctC